MHRCAKTFSAVLLLVVATCAAAQNALTLGKCKGIEDYHGFKNVTIVPCGGNKCVIKRGEHYNVTFYAEATRNTKNVQVTTVRQQRSHTTYMDLKSSVSCFLVDVPCTVTKGEVFRGSVELKLPKTFSPGELFYELVVKGDEDVFGCGKTTLTVE